MPDSPPVVLTAEQKHLAFAALQSSFHSHYIAWQAQFFQATGAQNIHPRVHPETAAWEAKVSQ